MSREVHIKCDVCKVKPAQPCVVNLGREMDAAGSMDTVIDEFDVCLECAIKLVNALITELPVYTRKEITKSIKVGTIWRPALS